MVSKWNWMMDWCFKKGYAPANSYYWNLANSAYNEYCLTP